MTAYFTADTHFGHKNVIKYSNRPFSSVEEMDDVLIQNWNKVVKPTDTVYHLGDFSLGKKADAINIFEKLNGKKHLIKGNHEKIGMSIDGWVFKKDYHELKLLDKRIVLMHYGMRVWNRVHHGAIQLYGHSHGSLSGTDQQLDVGVDCWNYTPITLEEILERLSTLPKHITDDHHKPEEK